MRPARSPALIVNETLCKSSIAVVFGDVGSLEQFYAT